MKQAAATIANENRASAAAFADSFAAHDKLAAARLTIGRATSSFALPWTLAMIVVGLLTLAACVLVPLHEENRKLAHAHAGLKVEADFVRAQADANREFVGRVHSDAALAERLAMRATRRPTAGKKFLDAEKATEFSSSPYALTRLAAPPPMPEYRSDLPPAAVALFGDARSRVVLISASLFLVAAAVILGKSSASVQSMTA